MRSAPGETEQSEISTESGGFPTARELSSWGIRLISGFSGLPASTAAFLGFLTPGPRVAEPTTRSSAALNESRSDPPIVLFPLAVVAGEGLKPVSLLEFRGPVDFITNCVSNFWN